MSSQFTIQELSLSGLKLIRRSIKSDDRGSLSKIFSDDEFTSFGWQNKSVKQVNVTITQKKGTIRGLHFQNHPFAEMKLVTCLKGEIWDVAVDLRKDSPTFLKWQAVCLSEDNMCSLSIPEGFAHGFQTMTDHCELLYLHSEVYDKVSEGAIRYDDPILGISWPLELTNISIRDQQHELINQDYTGINIHEM